MCANSKCSVKFSKTTCFKGVSFCPSLSFVFFLRGVDRIISCQFRDSEGEGSSRVTETLRKMLWKTEGAALSGLSSIGAPLPLNLISSHIQPPRTPDPLEIVFIVNGRGY